MANDEFIIDPWSYYDYKPAFSSTSGVGEQPMWVGDHQRRLNAYKLLESYFRLQSRKWLPTDTVSPEDQDARREYGDAGVIVNQILASLVGDSQNIVTEGAADAKQEEATAEQTYQEAIRSWAKRNRFHTKMMESERTSIKLGDSVYVLGWNDKKNDLMLRVWDPGFYYPVISSMTDEDEFPNKVHIAYEFEDGPPDKRKKFVKRMTWLLAEMEDGDTQELPWLDEPTNITCFYSEGFWEQEEFKNELDDFSDAKAEWIVEPWLDLEIDFIPIVHVPNTIPSGGELYGTSALALIIQILDDLVATDTDLQSASATTGSPPIALEGATAPKDSDGNIQSYGPGTVLETAEGKATLLDTSNSLDALTNYVDKLLSRVSVNGRIPESLLGRIKPSEVPSGIALTLSFAPHSTLIKEMRLVRREKYELLFKMVGRFLQQDGQLKEVYPTNLNFGTFLPADQKQASDIVQQLLNMEPPAISLETAVTMLIHAGFPIDDAVAEVEAIRHNDFKGASDLFEATADVNVSREYLGLEPITLTTEENPDNTPEPPDENQVVA